MNTEPLDSHRCSETAIALKYVSYMLTECDSGPSGEEPTNQIATLAQCSGYANSPDIGKLETEKNS